MSAIKERLHALRKEYEEYVDYFDPTPQYLYDEPYRLLDFDEWLEEQADAWVPGLLWEMWRRVAR